MSQKNQLKEGQIFSIQHVERENNYVVLEAHEGGLTCQRLSDRPEFACDTDLILAPLNVPWETAAWAVQGDLESTLHLEPSPEGCQAWSTLAEEDVEDARRWVKALRAGEAPPKDLRGGLTQPSNQPQRTFLAQERAAHKEVLSLFWDQFARQNDAPRLSIAQIGVPHRIEVKTMAAAPDDVDEMILSAKIKKLLAFEGKKHELEIDIRDNQRQLTFDYRVIREARARRKPHFVSVSCKLEVRLKSTGEEIFNELVQIEVDVEAALPGGKRAKFGEVFDTLLKKHMLKLDQVIFYLKIQSIG